MAYLYAPAASIDSVVALSLDEAEFDAGWFSSTNGIPTRVYYSSIDDNSIC